MPKTHAPHRKGASRTLQAQIEHRSVADLKANPRNARTHSPKQISQIAASIAEFGFTSPILIDGNDMVVAGHGRLEAAKKVGLSMVPTVSLDHLSPEQLRAYVIADNQLALKAGWDVEILGLELAELSALDLGFDLTITGFDWPDIDMAIGTPAAAVKDDPLDRIPETACTAVTRESDLWLIGPHRLICGDSTKRETFAALLGDERAQLVFCDPPYNVPIDGHVSGMGRTTHREFAMASGEMSEPEFTAFLTQVFRHLADWSVDGALHFQCMDFRHMREMLDAGAAAYSELKNLCVWAKTNAGMGSLYRSQHELVFVFKAGTAPHINNVELGRHGRYRTNLWTYAGANTFSRTRDDDLAAHPTVKPTALVADAILDASHPKDIVLDAFAGSGTTLVAAHKTRRRGFGIELDPIYCDVILKRLATVTGQEPRHAQTGQLFRDLEQRRLAELDSAPAYGAAP